MKNLLILFTSISLLTACATQPKTTLEKVKETATTSTNGDWHLLEEKDYSVRFPETPTSRQGYIPTEDMGNLMIKIFEYETEEIVYNITTTDYPKNIIHSSNTKELDNFYDGIRDDMLRDTKGTLLSETKIDIDGFEGRAMKIHLQVLSEDIDVLATINIIVVGSRMYSLRTVTETSDDNSLSINKFLNSFKISDYYKTVVRGQTVSLGESATTTETASGWQLYESEKGSYKITFPEVPVESEEVIDTEDGQLNTYSTLCKHYENKSVYLCSYIDYPEQLVNALGANRQKFYDNFIQGSGDNTDRKVLDVKKIKLNGMEGREAKIKVNKDVPVQITTRVFLISNRMYQLQVINEEDDKSIYQFLDSFELME